MSLLVVTSNNTSFSYSMRRFVSHVFVSCMCAKIEGNQYMERADNNNSSSSSSSNNNNNNDDTILTAASSRKHHTSITANPWEDVKSDLLGKGWPLDSRL